MGSAYAWLAMKDVFGDAACAAVDLARTGGKVEETEAEFAGAALPTGWYVVVANATAFDYFMDMDLGALSADHDLVVFEAEEHTMHFALAYWRGGDRLWHVIHDGEEGVYHLDAAGELPAEFDALHADHKAKQDAEGGEEADVDHLAEVPVELARRITGFGYNFSYPEGEAPAFEELEYAGGGAESPEAELSAGPGESGEPPPGQPQSGPDAGPAPSGRPISWWQRLFGRQG